MPRRRRRRTSHRALRNLNDPHALLLWLTIAVGAAALAAGATQLLRALAAFKRLTARVDAYGELPVVRAAKVAKRDVARLEAAAAAVVPLIARAQAALLTIRRGPLPEQLTIAIVRVRAELAAFRAFRAG